MPYDMNPARGVAGVCEVPDHVYTMQRDNATAAPEAAYILESINKRSHRQYSSSVW